MSRLRIWTRRYHWDFFLFFLTRPKKMLGQYFKISYDSFVNVCRAWNWARVEKRLHKWRLYEREPCRVDWNTKDNGRWCGGVKKRRELSLAFYRVVRRSVLNKQRRSTRLCPALVDLRHQFSTPSTAQMTTLMDQSTNVSGHTNGLSSAASTHREREQ